MRTFLISTAATIAIGYGALAGFGASAQPSIAAAQSSGTTLEAVEHDVKAVEDGAFVSRDLAFQRLTLEAELEAFYERLASEAEGLSEAERLDLYREAEAELTRIVLGSPTYSGPNLALGEDYLELAKMVLAQRLGFESVPV